MVTQSEGGNNIKIDVQNAKAGMGGGRGSGILFSKECGIDLLFPSIERISDGNGKFRGFYRNSWKILTKMQSSCWILDFSCPVIKCYY